MTRCAVIGGGMLGMALALRMARNGWSVTLYEQSGQLGGLAAPWSLGGVTWDRHPHAMLRSDAALLRLLGELHLENDIVWRRVRSDFFPALGALDKARHALAVRRAQRRKECRDLENVDVETWLRHVSGKRVFERIWRPLLLANLGSAYRQTSAAAALATIQQSYVGYVRGGYRTIIDALSEALVHEGVRIRTATTIERVRSVPPHLSVETVEGPRFYDRVIMTPPAPVIARVASALTGEEHDRLRAIAYQGVVCASLLLDQPLSDAYITNVADPEIPFTRAIGMTALVDPAAFGNRHLVYVSRHCTPRDSFFVLGDAEMRAQATRALQRMYPSLKAQSIRAFRVSRIPTAFAVNTVGYSGRVPGFLTSCPGLYIATSAQIVNGTRTINETLALADEAAAAIERDTRYARADIQAAH